MNVREVSQEMGPDGGILTLPDGPEVKVVFPSAPAALTKSTTVGLQVNRHTHILYTRTRNYGSNNTIRISKHFSLSHAGSNVGPLASQPDARATGSIRLLSVRN